MSSTLTAGAKKRITADWAAEFPGLGVYKPMWLMKRHGPMLIGLCLDRTRSNDEYIPLFHVHNLLAPKPVVVLMLSQGVPGERQPEMRRRIPVDRHESSFRPAAGLVKSLAPSIEEREVRLSTVLELYNDFIAEQRDPAIARQPWPLFTDVILLSFWAGHEAYARACLDAATPIIESWRSPQVEAASWNASLLAALDKARLEALCAEQLKTLAAEKVPASPLVIDDPPALTVIDVYRTTQKATV